MLFSSILLAGNLMTNPGAAVSNADRIIGDWKGIEMYQDENSYDGRTYYLPNSEELVITKNKFKVYFYPYSKSDEFEALITAKNIICTIGKKKVKSDYFFNGDTLVLSMNFINKNFIKMYAPAELDDLTIAELDGYGVNPSSLTNLYELDTLHPELRRGFSDFESLTFEPIQHIRFVDDYHIELNQSIKLENQRVYQGFTISHNGSTETYTMIKVEGTQQFSLIPSSHCGCDSIQIPYMEVNWANRIRKRILDEQSY